MYKRQVYLFLFSGEGCDQRRVRHLRKKMAHDVLDGGAAGVVEELFLLQRPADVLLEKKVPCLTVLVRIHIHGAVEVKGERFHW